MMSENRCVRVVAPARLHMGFIDISGTLGRRFGGIGVGFNELATRLSMRKSAKRQAHGPGSDRALKLLSVLANGLGVPDTVRIDIEEAIPEHVGLGSGTQMSLAIGLALRELFDLQLSTRELALVCDRGARSGIGIAVFEQGGFIVDGGRCEQTGIPPVIARTEFPPEWNIILIFDTRGQGLHGNHEQQAFKQLQPFAEDRVARFCHLLMMRALPALAEKNIDEFGSALTEIQCSIGDYFASVQGGRFTSPEVGEAVSWLGAQGAVGLGQSSWGPTGFCVAERSRADGLVHSAREYFDKFPTLRFMRASARNRGGEIALADMPNDNRSVATRLDTKSIGSR